MKLFPHAHATHPQWPLAAALVLAQLRAQMARPEYADSAPLGLLYITDHFAPHAQELLDHLSAELPGVVDWCGTTGVGICANNAEYIDEPALAVMLCDLPVDQYRVFNGVSPLPQSFDAQAALLHADHDMPDALGLIAEMAGRTRSGYLFGGLASSRGARVQFAVNGSAARPGPSARQGVFHGGLSGVALGEGVSFLSRVTQGCKPIAGWHQVTRVQDNLLLALDDEPALAVLLRDLGARSDNWREVLPRLRGILVGMVDPQRAPVPAGADLAAKAGQFGSDVIVRHLMGLDPPQHAVAVTELLSEGMRVAFCERNAHTARADLLRICAEIREEIEPEELPLATAAALGAPEAERAPHPARRIAGAVYVSCAGRGGPYFGSPGAELQIVRRALGDVPLVGFFAAGEIAHRQLYGYTGVLTVFTGAAEA